jgi:transposase
MIASLIKRQFGISLSKASVCRLLNQLGLSPQKPLWRAYQKCPDKIQKWINEEYPHIRSEARRQNARIFFGDEAGVRSDFHAGTTWAPVGQTPVIETTGARFGMNIISAVSARGKMRFMTVKGSVNARVFIDFLKRLLHNADNPVFLIVDGHPSHRAKCVANFVDSTDGRLRLFFLPGYSPELNPDEQVWNDLKKNGLGRKVIAGPKLLCRAVVSHLRSLQRRPSRMRSFLQLPETRYAAAL